MLKCTKILKVMNVMELNVIDKYKIMFKSKYVMQFNCKGKN